MKFIQAMAAIENIAKSAGVDTKPKVTIDFANEVDRARFRAAVQDELFSLSPAPVDKGAHKYDRMKGTVHGVDVDIL